MAVSDPIGLVLGCVGLERRSGECVREWVKEVEMENLVGIGVESGEVSLRFGVESVEVRLGFADHG